MHKTLMSVCAILFALFLFCAGCARAYDPESIHASLKGYLFINEIVASDSETGDWIELYNPTDSAYDLTGFYLSDDILNPLKWAFPEDTVILGNNFLVIMANNVNEDLQTNFFLGRDEAVVLTTPGGTMEIDSIDYIANDVPDNRSYGRYRDGGDIWITFSYPTMGSTNNQ